MQKPRDTKRSSGSKSRLETSDLASRIAKARGIAPGQKRPSGDKLGGMAGHNRAIRFGSEFIAAILVGAVIGYGLDKLLNTGPWLMLVMLLFGFGAGVLNITRAAAEMGAQDSEKHGIGEAVDNLEDDDLDDE